MQVIEVTQGTPQWLAVRAQHFCASDAPSAMGVSKYKSRQDLLREKATGYTPEVDPAKQALFDGGHAAEAAARPLVEELLGQELYPCVGTRIVDGLALLASLDGITIDDSIAWETKQWNEKLAASVLAGELEPHYWVQLEHELLVSEAEKVYFTTTDGTPDRMAGMWYESRSERRAQLIAAWKQFREDLAAYQPTEVLPAAVAAAQPSLPAVVVRMDGALTVASNLPDFAVALRAYIANIPASPSSDQEFADCEAACKSLKKAEDALQQAEDGALAQMTDVEQMRRVVGDLRTLARTTRLASEKMVAARKEAIRLEIYQGGIKAYQDHIAGLNARLGRPYMPALPVDFAGAIKNKRTVESLRDAVSTHLATAKIAANDVADRIQINLQYLREHAAEYAALFPDTGAIVLKAPDDLQALVKARIADHEKAEADRMERQRAKIAEEERIKAEAKVRAETAQREADEAAARAKAEVEARVAQEAIAAPVPAMLEPTVAAAPQGRVAYGWDKPASKPVAAPATPPSLRLGQIAERLGFSLTGDFLKELGFDPAATDKRAMLFHEHQFPSICRALIEHIEFVVETCAELAPA